LNRVRSKLQENGQTEDDKKNTESNMESIQGYLKSKDPAERKKAKSFTKKHVFNDEWPTDFKLVVDSLFASKQPDYIQLKATEEVFLNRVRSKLQENEKDDTKIKIIMDPIQDFLKSKDPAERKKAKKNTKHIVFNDVWPTDFTLIVDSLFDDPLKHDYMKQPWLALPIAVIMKRGSFKLFKRYGIQGLKLFEELRIKFETSISHCQVFHGDENTNEVGLKAMNTMWKDDIYSSKLALSEFPFRKDTDANNDNADGIFLKYNKSAIPSLGKNLYLNKLWNKINTPQEPTYTSIGLQYNTC